MACKRGKVYLGYEDEVFSDKSRSLSNYTVNKIGGFPDWPPSEQVQPSLKCPLCSLHRILVTQCYAPIDGSVYHRTLYVFACINPKCWLQSESWACFRCQIQDTSNSCELSTTVALPSTDSNLAWCNGADEWDENDNGDTENGNVLNDDNDQNAMEAVQRLSDEDEESNSFEVETMEQALGNLRVFDAHNANMSPVQGAEGAYGVAAAAAELEGGDEPGLVSVDTPTVPNKDLVALLSETSELPVDVRQHLSVAPMQFMPKYLYVEEEASAPTPRDDRVAELLNRYKRDNEMENAPSAGGGDKPGDDEAYEEAAPLHGDRLFHAFVTRIRQNPGQILRYSRSEPPLLGAPLPPSPTACLRCGAHLICELQLLPAFPATLRLLPSNAPLPSNATPLPSNPPLRLHCLSVLVFTCSQSCWQPGDACVTETVVFQPEI